MKSKSHIPYTFLLFLSIHSLLQETVNANNPWLFVDHLAFSFEQKQDLNLPNHFRLVKLQNVQIEKILREAPLRLSKVEEQKIELALPMPDGTFKRFTIVRAPVLHGDLARKFPMIQSYAGKGINHSGTVRFDWTPKGLHATIRLPNFGTILVEPLTKGDSENYIVYYKKDVKKNSIKFYSCGFLELEEKLDDEFKTSLGAKTTNCQMKTFRLALACTGEYAQYHGGATEDVLTAMNTTITRVNSVFESELSVSLQIIPNNTKILFLDSLTDPYSNYDRIALLNENQFIIDSLIGSLNYDIGHVLGTGINTSAAGGRVCQGNNKAKGITGLPIPEGVVFDIDFLSHEIGHQFGAFHTFSGNEGFCNGAVNTLSSVEPGSGSTIMAYAGICEDHNIQSNSDPYFHSISLDQINNYLSSIASCAQLLGNPYESPSANAGPDYIIPKSTPFVLIGQSNHQDTDNLSYNWEQIDRGLSFELPQATDFRGPLFRSFPPGQSPQRYFPNLIDLVNNSASIWEVLPSIGRFLNFRFTVRKSTLEGGCANYDDSQIRVSNMAGPFLVIKPNSTITWVVGSEQEIQWDVARTNQEPVNTDSVDIFLSQDGGLTYPVILAEKVPNDGRQSITVPTIITSQARIMVKASNNIFFDISDENFEITETTSTRGQNHIENNISLFPNPGAGKFFLQFPTKKFKAITISLFDVNGKMMFAPIKDRYAKDPYELDLSGLPAGIYFVNVFNEDQSWTLRLVHL